MILQDRFHIFICAHTAIYNAQMMRNKRSLFYVVYNVSVLQLAAHSCARVCFCTVIKKYIEATGMQLKSRAIDKPSSLTCGCTLYLHI